MRPCVLCPVDFSDASRGALRYAAALAEHFYAGLTVLTVNDPVINDVAVFVDATFRGRRPLVPELKLESANGLPAVEILRVATETHADVIVMSTHGAHARRTMLGSVTEQVLRATTIPVIVTPAGDPGPGDIEQAVRSVRRILVPVDLSAWTDQQITIAAGIGKALNAQVTFVHVLAEADPHQRLAAHRALDGVIRRLPPQLRPAMTIAVGDPATEIARVARDRDVNLIVMGLHTSDDPRKGVGHVTHALLCTTPTLVVAWPPKAVPRERAIESAAAP